MNHKLKLVLHLWSEWPGRFALLAFVIDTRWCDFCIPGMDDTPKMSPFWDNKILCVIRVLQTICTISIQPDFLYIGVWLNRYCACGNISNSEITIVSYSTLLLLGPSSVLRISVFKDLARSFWSLSFDERFRKNLALEYSNSCSLVPE